MIGEVLDLLREAMRKGTGLTLDPEHVAALEAAGIFDILRELALDEARAAYREQVCEEIFTTAAHPTMVVYFIRAVGIDAIKIGVATNLAARLRSLQIGSPVDLEVAATIPGSFSEERRLHYAFAADRIRGEWFRSSPELLAFIAKAGRVAA